MIPLVLRMLRARRFQAVTLAALATVAFAGAVAIPAFLAAVGRSVVATEIGYGPVDRRVIEAVNDPNVGSGDNPAFAADATKALTQPSLTTYYAEETTIAFTKKKDVLPRLQFRADLCDHVMMVSGRCPIGTAEVIVPQSLATTDGLSVGMATPIDAVKIVQLAKGAGIGIDYAGKPVTARVVGIYRPKNPSEPYWGESALFQADAIRKTDAPVFTSPGTLGALGTTNIEYVDAVLNQAAVQPDRLATVQAGIKRSIGAVASVSNGTESQIPQLLDDAQNDVRSARIATLIAALPIIAVGWVVIFLAGSYAVAGRREELGIVKLRGAPYLRRWWLGTGEALIAVVVALPLGYLLAALVMRITVRYVIPGRPAYTGIGHGALPYVLATLAGCVIAVIGAGFRTLATPATELLRGVPPRASRWRTATIEVLIVVLAAVSVEQMLSERGALAGIDIVAPSLAVAAVAVLLGRLFVPLVALVGRRGLQRGGRRRLGSSLGALQIARRPGVARLFVLTVIAIGLITYAAAGANVASRARAARAQLDTGGAGVVTVGAVTEAQLLADVRTADPGGTAAMAVARVPQRDQSAPPIIAVDATRLAAVSAWQGGSISAMRAAELLHPSVHKSITMTGGILSFNVHATISTPQTLDLGFVMTVEPSDGSPVQTIHPYQTDGSRRTYTVDAPMCRAGCRLAGLTIEDPNTYGGNVDVTISAVHVIDPANGTITGFTDPGGWQVTAGDPMNIGAKVSASAGALEIDGSSGESGYQTDLIPGDTVAPLPALATSKITSVNQGAFGFDQVSVPVKQVGQLPAVAGLPGGGILLDLEYVNRAAPSNGATAFDPQVWLSRTAPADMAERLTKAGLDVLSVQRVGPVETYLGNRGPAVGSRFALLAGIAVLLLTIGATILTAAVDRRRRGTELRALRVQGLAAGGVGRAAAFAYLGLTVLAVIGGGLAGLISWRLTGAKIPIFADGQTAPGNSIWPTATSMIGPFVVAALVLLIVSGVAAWDLRRHVRLGSAISGSGR